MKSIALHLATVAIGASTLGGLVLATPAFADYSPYVSSGSYCANRYDPSCITNVWGPTNMNQFSSYGYTSNSYNSYYPSYSYNSYPSYNYSSYSSSYSNRFVPVYSQNYVNSYSSYNSYQAPSYYSYYPSSYQYSSTPYTYQYQYQYQYSY